MSNISEAIIEVSNILNKSKVSWFLGSSAALLVQGIKIAPNDIDILYTKIGDEKIIGSIFAIENSNDSKEEMQTWINGVKVEFIYYNQAVNISHVNFRNVDIPVDSLENKLKYYKTVPGKEWVVGLIKDKMKGE